MSIDDRIRKRANFKIPVLIFGAAMTLFYLILGAMLLLNSAFLPGIPETFRHIFAVMLLVYGLYRGWRVYADVKP